MRSRHHHGILAAKNNAYPANVHLHLSSDRPLTGSIRDAVWSSGSVWAGWNERGLSSGCFHRIKTDTVECVGGNGRAKGALAPRRSRSARHQRGGQAGRRRLLPGHHWERPQSALCLRDPPRGSFAQAPISGWSKTKAHLDRLSGVTDWVLHDLRRCISTWMNESGTDPHIAEAVLGHVVKGVGGVYNKAAYLPQKRVALDLWAKHVEEIARRMSPAR